MATKNILINSSNVISGSNNTKYVYKFDQPQVFENNSIALSSLQIYYSWFNINSQLYNNNVFQYKWFNSSGVLSSTFTVTIPDGFYSITSINLYLQDIMLANGHYLYDTTTKKNIFFIEFVENSTYYGFQLNMAPMYALGAVPSNITKKGTWQYPPTQRTAQLIINSTNNFGTLTGFDSGTYPSGTVSTLFQQLSQNVPIISPVSSVIMRCNLVRNDLANPNDVLHSFTTNLASFGDVLNIEPFSLVWSPIQKGTYGQITISFFDQNYNPMVIKDNQLLMTIVIKDNPEKEKK